MVFYAELTRTYIYKSERERKNHPEKKDKIDKDCDGLQSKMVLKIQQIK